MVYNTEGQIRADLGMPASSPTSAVIAHWQLLIDNLIDGALPSVDSAAAATIEMNRVSLAYNFSRGSTEPGDRRLAFEPLSEAEIASLTPDKNSDPPIDIVPMNGKREVY